MGHNATHIKEREGYSRMFEYAPVPLLEDVGQVGARVFANLSHIGVESYSVGFVAGSAGEFDEEFGIIRLGWSDSLEPITSFVHFHEFLDAGCVQLGLG